MVGIYKITKIGTDKSYIGKSRNIEARWLTHIYQLNSNIHHNLHLQYSWIKNGEDCFSFEVIEECSLDELSDREDYWINKIGYYNHQKNNSKKIFRKINDITVCKHNDNTLQVLIDEGILVAEYDKTTFLDSTTMVKKEVDFWKEIQDILKFEKNFRKN